MASAAAQMSQWSGEKPADGGFYVLRNDRWYCQLCWKVADESHVFSNPHRTKMSWHFRPGQPYPPSDPTWEPPPDTVWGVAAAGVAAAGATPPPQPAQGLQVGQLQLTAAGMPGSSQQLPVAAAKAAAPQLPLLQLPAAKAAAPQLPLLQVPVAAAKAAAPQPPLLPVAAAAAAAQPPVLQPQPQLLQLAVAAEAQVDRLAQMEDRLARMEELLREVLGNVAWRGHRQEELMREVLSNVTWRDDWQ